MAITSTTGRQDAATLAKASVGLGVLAIIAFFGLGFVVGGWWFVIAFAIGLAAVACAWVARQRNDGHRPMATIGLVIGAVPVVWFVVYMIVAAIF